MLSNGGCGKVSSRQSGWVAHQKNWRQRMHHCHTNRRQIVVLTMTPLQINPWCRRTAALVATCQWWSTVSGTFAAQCTVGYRYACCLRIRARTFRPTTMSCTSVRYMRFVVCMVPNCVQSCGNRCLHSCCVHHLMRAAFIQCSQTTGGYFMHACTRTLI